MIFIMYKQGCSGKNILGHTLRPGVQGAAQAPPAAEALRALLMQILSHCEKILC